MFRFSASLLILASLLPACARFRITDLKPSVLLSLPMHNNPYQAKTDQLLVSVNEGALYDLPARPGIYDNRILLALPEKNVVVEFSEGNTTPERLFVPDKTSLAAPFKDSKIKVTQIPAGQIGQAVPDDEATIIQLYAPIDAKKAEENEPEHRMPSVLFPETMTQPPSELIVLATAEDKPLKLRADNDGSTTFRQVWQILPGEDDLLYVLHSPDEGRPVLNIYHKLQLQTVLSVPDSLLTAKDTNVELETILPYRGRSEALASVVLRRKNNYEPTERILYLLAASAEPVEVFRYDEKEDLPIWSRKDGGFLLAHDEDGTAMLLKLYAKGGEYERNNRIHYEGLRESYQDTFFNGEDRIFSVRIERGVYEIVEWK